jgi:hypothetical protein
LNERRGVMVNRPYGNPGWASRLAAAVTAALRERGIKRQTPNLARDF